jgi:hypothetical protein
MGGIRSATRPSVLYRTILKYKQVKRQYRFFLYLQMAVLVLLQSCIGEGNPDCPPENVRVYFAYRTTYGPGLLDPGDVNRFNLFVFDADNKFVGEWIDENPSLSPSYYMELPLPYGTYSFVCWGGLDTGCYTVSPDAFTVGQTGIEECLLSLKRTENNTVEYAPNHLFYAGRAQQEINTPGQTFALELRQLTNTINVTTGGLEAPGHNYSLLIEDNNGDHRFDGSCASTTKLQYISPCSQDDGGQLRASLRVLSLSGQRSPTLILRDESAGKNVYSANLVELILKLRNKDVTVDFEDVPYDIHLKFDANMDVWVNINGWNVNEAQNEI